MRTIREVAHNIPDGYGVTEDRLFGCNHMEWVLYVCDHYWVLDISDHLEFYYNPEHGIGKIHKKELPPIVFERLKNQCVVFNSQGECYWHEKIITEEEHVALDYHVDFRQLEDNLRIGNWFYAQGYNYVTTRNRFYEVCFPYDHYGREWNLWDMKIHDMIRMSCSTKTHHFLRTVWDLECFQQVDHSLLMLKPFREEAWDSEQWKKDFNYICRGKMDQTDKSILRFMRQKVFLHTVYVARMGWYCSEKGNRIEFPNPNIMQQMTRLYTKKISIEKIAYVKTEIIVENIDCLLAAQKWVKKGYRVAVLNMASRQNPGGGVYSGAGAQEENLFRRTNLFQSMYLFVTYGIDYGIKRSHSGYPLDRNYGGIYSPRVFVFRGLEKDGYPLLDNPFTIDVISVPGMNRPALDDRGMIAGTLVDGVENKMRTIFDIALQNKNDCLILGAYGCGAFKNPPHHIAKLFHKLLQKEYSDVFKVIVFAILDDHNSGRDHNRDGNYLPFVKEFQ